MASSFSAASSRKRPASPPAAATAPAVKQPKPTHSFFAPASARAKADKAQSAWVQSAPPSLLHYSHLAHLVRRLPSALPSSSDLPATSASIASSSSSSAAAGPPASNNATHAVKVAFFDLDGTLITTASGNKFPRDGADWKFLAPCVAGQLKALHADGWRIAVISNQNGLPISKSGAQKKRDQWRTKIEAIARKFPETPFEVLAAVDKDHFRKPLLGMWDYYVASVLGAGEVIDLAASYYVGDAAGRRSDHGAGDRKWAENAQIAFHTPETYFLRKAEELPPLQGFRPSQLESQPFFTPTSTPLLPPLSHSELLLLVGAPGSGKSLFCAAHLAPAGYERVNADVLGSRAKCERRVRKYLEAQAEGAVRRVVVDNTNRDRGTRRVWCDLAREFNLPVRVILFPPTPTALALAAHNNLYRLYPSAPGAHVPPVAAASFVSAYEEPVAGEGSAGGVGGVGEVKRVWMGGWSGGEGEERRRWEGWMS